MRLRSLIGVLVLTAAMCLPLLAVGSASAESGAHRHTPPPPPVDTPIRLGDRD